MPNYNNEVIPYGGKWSVGASEVANNIIIQSGGRLYVSAGGLASNVTVSDGGYLGGSRGTTRNAVILSGGQLAHDWWTGASYDTVAHSGAQILGFTYVGASPQTLAELSNDCVCCNFSSAVVNSGWDGKVGANGKVFDITVKYGGKLHVYENASATGVSIQSGGRLYVSAGGLASNVTVSDGGYLGGSRGTTRNAVILSGGQLAHDWWTGASYDIVAHSGAQILGFTYVGASPQTLAELSNDCVVCNFSSALVNSGWDGKVGANGKVSDITVKYGGKLHVYENASATDVSVQSGGRLYVSVGGLASNVTVSDGGYLGGSRGTTRNAVILSGGQLAHDWWTGASYDIVAHSGAQILGFTYVGASPQTLAELSNDCVCCNFSSAVVNSGWDGKVGANGKVSDITVKYGGKLHIYENASATGVSVQSGGRLYVSEGGLALRAAVSNGGSAVVARNGKSLETIVNSGGTLNVENLGTASIVFNPWNGTVVAGNGAVVTYLDRDANVYWGCNQSGLLGRANTVTGPVISSGVSMLIFQDGKVTGEMDFQKGAYVSSYQGGIIDFDIQNRAAAAPALLNDLSIIQGSPSFTITVSNSQANGIYALADGAANFTGSMTVRTQSSVLTDITVGGEMRTAQGRNFWLRKTDGRLSLIVEDSSAVPKVISVTADVTAPTNRDVTVTALFDLYNVIGEYSLDQHTWQTLSGGVKMSANGTVYFRGRNNNGTSPVVSYTVSNIDKVAPTAPTVKASTNAATNKNVTLTATYSSDSVTKQYSTDKKTWKSYTAALSVAGNATYYFRGIDAAGNISNVTSYKVSNIDKTAPDQPTVKASTTAVTNKNVTLTATYSSDTATKQYSTDNKTWKSYTAALSVAANATYYFRGIDAAGNISAVTTIKVANIDKVAPTAPTVKASTTAATNKNVTLTATFSSDSVTKQYSTDNKTWKTYSSAVSVAANATYYFRGLDAAGNISKVTSYKVSNIDKVAPTAPTVKASTTAATNKNVTLTATYSSDTATKQYSTDNKTWKSYTAALSVAANATYYFRALDAAGNVSKVTTIKVANIDKVAPTAPTVKASTTVITDKAVTLTATFSSDTRTKQYSTDNKTWKTYSAAVSASANGTWYFRGVDAAGNVSPATSFTVSNIVSVPAPTGLTVQVSKYNITGKWAKVTAAKDFKVKYQVKLDGTVQAKQLTSLSSTVKNLSVGTHTFAVSTIFGLKDGRELQSAWRSLSVKVADVTAPTLGAVSGSVNGYTGTIKLAATDNVAVKHYMVTMDGVAKKFTGSAASFKNLAVGKHTASVQAFDAAGNASKAKKVTLTVVDVTAPGKVTKVNAVSEGKGKATLNWNAVSDNSGLPVSYEVELSTGKIVKAKTNSCSVKLAAGSYTYRVRAIDKAKNVGAWSAKKSFSIATAAKSAAIALSYCDTLRLDSALKAAADASSLTASAVKEQAYLAAL